MILFIETSTSPLCSWNGVNLLQKKRVITHSVLVESDGADITLVTIYDKSDQASISNRELRKLMKKNGLE